MAEKDGSTGGTSAFKLTWGDMITKATDIAVPWVADRIVALIPEASLDLAGNFTSHWADMVYALVIPNTVPGSRYIDDARSRLITALKERIENRKQGRWIPPQGPFSIPQKVSEVFQSVGFDLGRLRPIEGWTWWDLMEFYTLIPDELRPTYTRFLRSNLVLVARPTQSTKKDGEAKKGGKKDGSAKDDEAKTEVKKESESGLEVIRNFVAASYEEKLAQIRMLYELEGGNGATKANGAVMPLREFVLVEITDGDERQTILNWLEGLDEATRIHFTKWFNNLPSRDAQMACLHAPENQRLQLAGPVPESHTLTQELNGAMAAMGRSRQSMSGFRQSLRARRNRP